MNIHSILEYTHNESLRASGASDAYGSCYQELKKMVNADNVETKCVLSSVPEPSDSERATWTDVTREYVAMLEDLVDSRIFSQQNLISD